MQRKWFDGEVEYERFYRYLRYASMNTFEHLAAVYWDKLEQLLREDGEPRAADWFKNSLTGKNGCWMMAHSGPGLSNTNCSMEVYWRDLKGATLGSAGSSGGGYSQLRVQSNLTGFIEDESRKSITEMALKGQLVCFPTEGVYTKAMYDKLQDLPGNYMVICESMAIDDVEFRNVRRIVAVGQGVSLYSRIMNCRSDHRWDQTILRGNREVIMLSKFGEDNMKIDVGAGRRAATSQELQERMQRFKDLMFTELTPEDVQSEPKKFFKTCSSFHLVTACDGAKAKCSCTGYYQHMGCEHAMLMDMLYDRAFKVPDRFEEECAEFRKRVGRRKGVQQEETEKKGKKSEWDVIICGGLDESEEEEEQPVREFERIVKTGDGGTYGYEDSSGGEKAGKILTPAWRKIEGTDTELSGESTYASDGKMGRWMPPPYRPRGQYAMGAPRTDMSHCFKTWVPDTETESSEWEQGGRVSV